MGDGGNWKTPYINNIGVVGFKTGFHTIIHETGFHTIIQETGFHTIIHDTGFHTIIH